MKNIIAVYFSPTLTTKKIVCAIADSIHNLYGKEYSRIDFDITSPKRREDGKDTNGNIVAFAPNDIVVFGAPVYIGRMPNLISPYFASIKGNGAIAIPVAVYGNRAYDNGLIELRDILTNDGFNCIAAGAFIGEHSFSEILGKGRPDGEDIEIANNFGKQIAIKISDIKKNEPNEAIKPIEVKGEPYPYSFFTAVDNNKKKVDIRKVKPQTNKELCNRCGLCAQLCPMGSITANDCSQIAGICIKCGACVKRCPSKAKYFDDPVYIEHKRILEESFSSIRKEPELFI